MSLKRKRLDEILSTSIEDIENMFSWKIGARKVECPIASPSNKSTSSPKTGQVPKEQTAASTAATSTPSAPLATVAQRADAPAAALAKKRKLSSDSNSCFSSQYSLPSTQSSNQQNYQGQQQQIYRKVTTQRDMQQQIQIQRQAQAQAQLQRLRMERFLSQRRPQFILRSSKVVAPLIDLDEDDLDLSSVPDVDMIDILVSKGTTSLH